MTRSQAQQEADQAALIVNSRPASGRLMCDNVLHVCERGGAGRCREVEERLPDTTGAPRSQT